MVIECLPFQVVGSKAGEDVTGQTLLRVITEQEDEGHSSLLINRVLKELICCYGDELALAMQPFWSNRF